MFKFSSLLQTSTGEPSTEMILLLKMYQMQNATSVIQAYYIIEKATKAFVFLWCLIKIPRIQSEF